MKSSLKISEKLHSAFLLSTSLAAHYQQGTWLTLSQVAEKFHLSQGYLEEIVAALRQAKLVQGRRGASGGYRLSRPPHSITYADIVKAIEGPQALVDCQNCFLHNDCSNEPLWQELQTVVMNFFGNKTLAGAIERSVVEEYNKRTDSDAKVKHETATANHDAVVHQKAAPQRHHKEVRSHQLPQV